MGDIEVGRASRTVSSSSRLLVGGVTCAWLNGIDDFLRRFLDGLAG